MIRQEITYGSKTIPYQLKHSQRKTLGIQVLPSGQVVVTAPLESDSITVRQKVQLKAPWIIRQVASFDKYKPAAPPRKYVNGESHLYLGRQYRLKSIEDFQSNVKAYRGQLWVHTTKSDHASIQNHLNAWYLERAKTIFHQILDEVLPKFRRYLKNKPSLSIRKMKTRWGSCTPAGRIMLNPELIKAPKGCIEYVIIHEMCHLVHPNHARSFYKLLGRFMPDWQKWKLKLEHSII